ncbi:MAG: WXG100 family type VII secretion target [Blautia sp.]|nr:WXG100 family type VII secretion target [Blautia sp.]
MASEIRVTSASLRSKNEELIQLNQNFMETADSMENTVHTLEGSWEGESHDAFYTAFSTDKGKMGTFSGAITQYTTALEQIIAKYEAAEAQNVTIASSRTY